MLQFESALFTQILQAEGFTNFIRNRTNHSIMNNIYVLISIGLLLTLIKSQSLNRCYNPTNEYFILVRY